MDPILDGKRAGTFPKSGFPSCLLGMTVSSAVHRREESPVPDGAQRSGCMVTAESMNDECERSARISAGSMRASRLRTRGSSLPISAAKAATAER